MRRIGYAICLWTASAGVGPAEPASNPALTRFLSDRQPLFSTAQGTVTRSTRASLFVDTAEGGLFAALPGRLDAPMRRGGTIAARLRDLIASVEAGRADYDAVQYGARVKPPKPPTAMTLGEMYAWIDATPGQPHAIGRYQFIPATLRHSAGRLALPPTTAFTPELQDQLADLLLGDAGLENVRQGVIPPETFMNNLARIWAGLPTTSGRSYYQGIAGNKAVIGYETYARQLQSILDG